MFRDAALIAGKDLRLEARARVALNQVAPFALLVLVLFAFALDPDRGVLDRATPGLYWVAVLFSALLAVQRAFSLEAADGVRDGLRLSGLDPAGIFLGKVARGRRCSCSCSRPCCSSAWSCSTTPTRAGSRSLVPTCLARHARAGRGRHPLRRAGRRAAGAGDDPAAAAAARRRPRAHRGDPGLRGRLRRPDRARAGAGSGCWSSSPPPTSASASSSSTPSWRTREVLERAPCRLASDGADGVRLAVAL